LFFLPFNLIQVQGYTPLEAGMVFLPFVLIMFLLSRWAGGLADRHGPRLPLIVGPAIAACGFILFALPGIGGSYWTTFFPAVMVMGLGMAISVAPLTTAVMNAVESRHAGVASGLNNTASRVAGLLAIAVLGIVILNSFNQELDLRLSVAEISSETQRAFDDQRIKLAAAEIPAGISNDAHAVLRDAIDQSFVAGFKMVMLIAAGLALMGSVVAALMIQGKPVKPPTKEL
jgi:MFS family permease